MKKTLLLIFLLLATDLSAEVAVSPIRKAFDNCFWDSSAAQIKRDRNADINLVAETAFVSCASEERAIQLMAARLGPAEVEKLLVGIRLQLKRQLQDIARNPAGYVGVPKTR